MYAGRSFICAVAAAWNSHSKTLLGHYLDYFLLHAVLICYTLTSLFENFGCFVLGTCSECFNED